MHRLCKTPQKPFSAETLGIVLGNLKKLSGQLVLQEEEHELAKLYWDVLNLARDREDENALKTITADVTGLRSTTTSEPLKKWLAEALEKKRPPTAAMFGPQMVRNADGSYTQSE